MYTLDISIPGSIYIQELNSRGLEENVREEHMSIPNLLSSIVKVQVVETLIRCFPFTVKMPLGSVKAKMNDPLLHGQKSVSASLSVPATLCCN